jgi:hypothetical protein
MAVARLEVTRRSTFPLDYERIDGILHFTVDPCHGANERIVDLDRAPRDADGRVPFSADFVLLQPADAEGANRRLLYYVVNRGQRFGVPFNRVPSRKATLPPTDDIDPGDGFLMRRGWTVAICGWQWDVERQPGLTGLEAPQALGPDGRPIQGRVSISFQPNALHMAHRLAHWPLHPEPGRQTFFHRPYSAADVNETGAELSVRDTRHGPKTVIPRERWRFARDEGGRATSDDSHVWLDGGFQPGLWYEVTYTTRICPVVGTGLLATRDCVAWLRYERPLGRQIDFTYAHGRSQCGRFLRQFVYEGLNLDEAGRQVFDGLIPDVAGARRGEFNHRYAQPSETNPNGVGGQFPFHSDDMTDPLTGQSDGLLKRQRELGGVPKIFTTNTSSEYWRSDCSLIHTDPTGTRDAEPPSEERQYFIAGHQHGYGEVEINDVTPIGARGAHNFNVVDGSTVLRAFLINLDKWVSEGIEPPPSTLPRLSDGTAVPREAVLDRFRTFPGAVLLDPIVLPRLNSAYTTHVPAVDEDGNEVCGVRVPDVSVPVATHTGWVARHPATGGDGQLLDMMGMSLPFPATEAERQASGDPRRSIAERYRDRAAYLARARQAAAALAAQRYILEEDIELAAELAAQRYELVSGGLGVGV